MKIIILGSLVGYIIGDVIVVVGYFVDKFAAFVVFFTISVQHVIVIVDLAFNFPVFIVNGFRTV